jgi:CheY-like chemotaxis protein
MQPKILVVDDSKTIRVQVCGALARYECTILEAQDGLEGLSLARGENPDIILLDSTMPKMSGLGMLARLRSDPAIQRTPVVMLTSDARRQTVVTLSRLGVVDYIIKPFKSQMLIDRITRIVTLAAIESIRPTRPSAAANEHHPTDLEAPRYFQRRDQALIVVAPGDATDALHWIARSLDAEVVKATLDTCTELIVDLTGIRTVSVEVVELVVRAMAASRKRSLGCVVAATDQVKAECRTFQEAIPWHITGSVDEALALTSPATPH